MVRPEVQMTEMKIEQYVPRGKMKSAEAANPDPEVDELTEEEKALLRKYALPPGAEPWKPSLIAFPKYQLLPTPVHSVKHSIRTTSMFIDVLRGLQESASAFLGTAKDGVPSQLGVSIFILPLNTELNIHVCQIYRFCFTCILNRCDCFRSFPR